MGILEGTSGLERTRHKAEHGELALGASASATYTETRADTDSMLKVTAKSGNGLVLASIIVETKSASHDSAAVRNTDMRQNSMTIDSSSFLLCHQIRLLIGLLRTDSKREGQPVTA